MGNKIIKTFLTLAAADAVIIGTWVYGKTQYYRGRGSAFKEAKEELEKLSNEVKEILEFTESEEL